MEVCKMYGRLIVVTDNDIDITINVLYTSGYRGTEQRSRRLEFNRSSCKPTSDVIRILTANPIAKAWAAVKDAFSVRSFALAPVTA